MSRGFVSDELMSQLVAADFVGDVVFVCGELWVEDDSGRPAWKWDGEVWQHLPEGEAK